MSGFRQLTDHWETLLKYNSIILNWNPIWNFEMLEGGKTHQEQVQHGSKVSEKNQKWSNERIWMLDGDNDKIMLFLKR